MLPRGHLQILKALQRRVRFPIYLVGGAPRDRLLGRTTLDFDLAVLSGARALAEQFARTAKGRLIILDEKRRVFRVAFEGGLQYDFADFERPSIEQDLCRRDFTINAMAAPLARLPQLDLLDPFNGLMDLRKKIIRMVDAKNLTADPLRLLRAFRFAAALGFNIDPATLAAIRRKPGSIRRAAPERIRFELMSLLCSDNAAPVLKQMDETRLLSSIFPDLERARNLARQYYKQGGVLGHVLESVGCFEDNRRHIRRQFPRIADKIEEYIREPIGGGFPRYATLKLAVLLHDVAKPHTAKKIKGRLRFFGHDERGAKIFAKLGHKGRYSAAEIELICKVIRAHLRPGNLAAEAGPSDKAVYRFFRDLGPDGVGVLLCALADYQSYIPKSKRWSPREKSVCVIGKMLHRYYEKAQKVTPPKIIDGHDVMKILGLAPSPRVGEILDEIRVAQSEGKIQSREQALRALKTFKL